MKKVALFLACALVAGAAFAGEMKKADAAAKPAVAAAKTHDVSSEVVSADVTAKTVTLKGEKGNMTAKCEGKAADMLKSLKPGDKVSVTCRDNEKGEHEAATDIKVIPAAAKK